MPLNSTSTLADKYFSSIRDEAARNQIVSDLIGIGVTEPFFPNVHVATSAEQVEKWVTARFRLGEPVIIFGTFGTGKTQIIRNVAAKLGMNLITDSVSTKLPEDFGGIPMPLTVDMDDDVFRASVALDLKNKKLDELVNKELEKQKAVRSITNDKILRDVYEKRFASQVKVTDAEIDAALPKYSKSRIVQKVSAPDWVFKIIDNYRVNGKRTVMFFDEINQGQQGTLNTLFDLVQQQRYGDRDEYSLADAVVFAAAGNFVRDNPSVSEMQLPLLDRFKFIIYFSADWGGSIDYIKKIYLEAADEYPHLAKLLTDPNLDDIAFVESFPSPRAIENFIKGLADLEQIAKTEGPQALDYIDSLDAVGLTERNRTSLALPVKIFLANIGVPFYAEKAANSVSSSQMMKIRSDTRAFRTAWVDYKRSPSGKTFKGHNYTHSDEDKLAFFKALLQAFPNIQRETLDTLQDHNGVSALQELRDAGLSEADLPTR